MDIFLRAVGLPGTGPELAEDPRQALAERIGLVRGDDAHLSQHLDVRKRALEVLLRDPPVHLERRCELAQDFVLVAFEPSSEKAHSPSEILLPPRVRNRSALSRIKPAASAWSKTSSASKVATASS